MNTQKLCIKCRSPLESWNRTKHCISCLNRYYGKPATPKQLFARNRNWCKANVMGVAANINSLLNSKNEYLTSPEKATLEEVVSLLKGILPDWEDRTKRLKEVKLK